MKDVDCLLVRKIVFMNILVYCDCKNLILKRKNIRWNILNKFEYFVEFFFMWILYML